MKIDPGPSLDNGHATTESDSKIKELGDKEKAKSPKSGNPYTATGAEPPQPSMFHNKPIRDSLV